MATAFLADPIAKEHIVPTGHPERPRRWDAAVRGLGDTPLTETPPREATEDQRILVSRRQPPQCLIVRSARIRDPGNEPIGAGTHVGRGGDTARIARAITERRVAVLDLPSPARWQLANSMLAHMGWAPRRHIGRFSADNAGRAVQ